MINHCIQQLDLLLCRRNTKVTKKDVDVIMNAFKNENTFTMHSRQSIEGTPFEDEKISWRNKILEFVNKYHHSSTHHSSNFSESIELYIYWMRQKKYVTQKE